MICKKCFILMGLTVVFAFAGIYAAKSI